MNEKFVRMLADRGWERRDIEGQNEWQRENWTNYFKMFDVQFKGEQEQIPINVSLSGLDSEDLPRGATYSCLLKPPMHVSYTNSYVWVSGAYRIVCNLDQAGYMMAMKWVVYSHPHKNYIKDGKAILSNYHALPNQ